MNHRYVFFGLILAGSLTLTGVAHAAQGSPNRDPHVCAGGLNVGMACTENSQCPESTCKVNYLTGPGTTFSADMFLIVDDDVSKWDGTEEVSDVVAVTILLKFRYKGEEYLLAQTYQNLEGGDLATLIENLQKGPVISDTNLSTGLNVEESDLVNALNPANEGTPVSLLDDLLWQRPDSEMAEELRRIFNVTGNPIVSSTPQTLAGVKHTICPSTECETSGLGGLATTVRLKVKFRFQAP
jgi:hypothetical protein